MKKTRKTIQENKTGGNLKFQDQKKLFVENKTELMKKIKQGKAPGYEIVKGKTGDYPRSKKDNSKKNNLDPEVKIKGKK